MSGTDLLTSRPTGPAPDRAPRPALPARFRTDVEGLRALAVLLVVAFHAGVGVVSGGFIGVDVFFVISGFLITGLLVDELRRTGRISLVGFYARRIRRLLPLATTVVLVTAFASAVVLPALDRPAVGADLRAAALWFANWRYAADATDYMADVDKSPALHYWSLSVEEQFYVVWPLLMLLVVGGAAAVRRSWRLTRARLALALLVLAVASYLLSVLTTAGSGPWAYFGLHTRAWELAAGGLLALGLPLLARVPWRAAVLLGYAGLAAVAGSAVLLDETSLFPGSIAAWPVLGTVAMLASGARTQVGVPWLLSRSGMTYVGRISYGWYLWHWPCLVLAKAAWGPTSTDPDLGPPDQRVFPVAVAVVVSFLLASATYTLVEQPFRTSRALAASKRATLAVGAAMLVLSVVAATVLVNGAVGDEATPTGAVQAPAKARLDTGNPDGCFVDFAATEADESCVFGDTGSDKVVVLMGDSHGAHWFPAMEAIAKRRHWQLWYWAKPACGYADVPLFTKTFKRTYTECADWRESVLKRIDGLESVDAVVIGRSYSYVGSIQDGSGKQPGGARAAGLWGAGADRTLDRLAQVTDRVVVIREIPRPGQDVPACLADHPGDAAACSFPRAKHTGLDTLLYDAERATVDKDLVAWIDLTDAVCVTKDPCSVVSRKGNIVFRDLHHLTASFAREISPALERLLRPYAR